MGQCCSAEHNDDVRGRRPDQVRNDSQGIAEAADVLQPVEEPKKHPLARPSDLSPDYEETEEERKRQQEKKSTSPPAMSSPAPTAAATAPKSSAASVEMQTRSQTQTQSPPQPQPEKRQIDMSKAVRVGDGLVVVAGAAADNDTSSESTSRHEWKKGDDDDDDDELTDKDGVEEEPKAVEITIEAKDIKDLEDAVKKISDNYMKLNSEALCEVCVSYLASLVEVAVGEDARSQQEQREREKQQKRAGSTSARGAPTSQTAAQIKPSKVLQIAQQLIDNQGIQVLLYAVNQHSSQPKIVFNVANMLKSIVENDTSGEKIALLRLFNAESMCIRSVNNFLGEVQVLVPVFGVLRGLLRKPEYGKQFLNKEENLRLVFEALDKNINDRSLTANAIGIVSQLSENADNLAIVLDRYGKNAFYGIRVLMRAFARSMARDLSAPTPSESNAANAGVHQSAADLADSKQRELVILKPFSHLLSIIKSNGYGVTDVADMFCTEGCVKALITGPMYSFFQDPEVTELSLSPLKNMMCGNKAAIVDTVSLLSQHHGDTKMLINCTTLLHNVRDPLNIQGFDEARAMNVLLDMFEQHRQNGYFIKFAFSVIHFMMSNNPENVKRFIDRDPESIGWMVRTTRTLVRNLEICVHTVGILGILCSARPSVIATSPGGVEAFIEAVEAHDDKQEIISSCMTSFAVLAKHAKSFPNEDNIKDIVGVSFNVLKSTEKVKLEVFAAALRTVYGVVTSSNNFPIHDDEARNIISHMHQIGVQGFDEPAVCALFQAVGELSKLNQNRERFSRHGGPEFLKELLHDSRFSSSESVHQAAAVAIEKLLLQ